jgi:hypothetical protein
MKHTAAQAVFSFGVTSGVTSRVFGLAMPSRPGTFGRQVRVEPAFSHAHLTAAHFDKEAVGGGGSGPAPSVRRALSDRAIDHAAPSGQRALEGSHHRKPSMFGGLQHEQRHSPDRRRRSALGLQRILVVIDTKGGWTVRKPKPAAPAPRSLALPSGTPFRFQSTGPRALLRGSAPPDYAPWDSFPDL